MIEVCLFDGYCFHTDFKFNVFAEMLDDPMVPPETFIPITIEDGKRALVRKDRVSAVWEMPDSQNDENTEQAGW